MNKQQVIDLMRSSNNENEWNDNCDKVKAAYNGGYPDFWFTEIILSGLVDDVLGQSAKIQVKSLSFG